jgi:hypothetical protein
MGGSKRNYSAGGTRDAISRRKMLKRMGAGAAVAWSAPILTSVSTPAFASYPPVRPLCVIDPSTGDCIDNGCEEIAGARCEPSPCRCVAPA